MTEEQASRLKPGDVLWDIKDKKEIIIKSFSFGDYKGRKIIYVEPENTTCVYSLPYYLDELELVGKSDEKCTCDFYKVLLRYGCQCGKEK